jgi:predicted RNA-binding protein with PUA-like domain/DNA replication protein DnaC
MLFKPESITKDHILQAVERIEKEQIDLKGATKYQVVINGKEYPPKEIMRYAHEEMNGEHLWEYPGGYPTNKWLEKLGFEIIQRMSPSISLEKNSSYWIFQANPDHFDIHTALKNNQLNSWTVRGHKDKIKEGDKVIIWLTGKESGCYALAEVISEPYEDSGSDAKLWKKENKIAHQADIKVTHNLLDNPIGKEEIKSIAGLDNMKVGNQGTNFSATKEEFDILRKMAESRVNHKVWIYSPGEGAYLWEEFYQDGIMAIGWDELGDLSQYDTKEEIAKTLREQTGESSSKKNDATANYEFRNIASVGDLVIVKRGKHELLGYGYISSDYKFDDSRSKYKSLREVNWEKKGSWLLDESLALKTFTDITDYETSHSNYLLYYERLLGIMNNEPQVMDTEKKADALNTILFGPPGTGKTYNTINKALEIIGEDLTDLSRKKIKELYKSRIDEGQIVFTTFHQSMSYEDFVEGIKPIKPKPDDTYLKYDINKGLFFQISEEAKSNYENSKKGNEDKLKFEIAFEKLKDEWEENPEMKFPLKTKGYDYTIIGFTNTSIQFKKASGGTGHTLSINTLRDLYYGKEINFNAGVGIYYPAILEKLNSYKGDGKTPYKNYVMIIDEINRGNVSQIFGELITLLEEDKRIDKPEMLEVELPYSKEKFSVPPNLYIIGTMNTADRSVEALDTALRRRFSFEEMPPKPDLLKPENLLKHLWYQHSDSKWKDPKWINEESAVLEFFNGTKLNKDKYKALEDGDNPAWLRNNPFENIIRFNPEIDLYKLLNSINSRIEKLIDKDHKIGHSYFINVRSIDDLKLVFKDKVIPLLEEYFFGDFGKIGLVLGKSFIEKEESEEFDFADFEDYDNYIKEDLSKRATYRIKHSSNWDFKSVYDAIQK